MYYVIIIYSNYPEFGKLSSSLDGHIESFAYPLVKPALDLVFASVCSEVLSFAWLLSLLSF